MENRPYGARPEGDIPPIMKKFLSLMIGLSLLVGSATLVVAQEEKKGEGQTEGKKKGKKGKKKAEGEEKKAPAR